MMNKITEENEEPTIEVGNRTIDDFQQPKGSYAP